MTLLKIKAFLYRKGFPYLAHKEELEYITSEEACNKIEEIMTDPDYSLYNAQGLAIGLWQAEYRFTRRYRFSNRGWGALGDLDE